DLRHHRQLKSQAVVPLRSFDPLLHLAPLRFGEKVSTYFRTGHRQLKSQAVVPLRSFDPLLHLAPLRFGEKVSTYFRTGQMHEKKPGHFPAFSCG
ncbi:hypothetical protein, partial [Burkholderia sp. AU45251]|uniref:hypothetical protein n=1 Tax=Burkholderia sp. AU45251 TaxID=3059204 RepID=UPI002654A53F